MRQPSTDAWSQPPSSGFAREVQWHLPITAVVLAGGASRRMGRDKASLEIEGITLLERVLQVVTRGAAEALVVGRHAPPRLPEGVRFVADLHPGLGPLAGLEAALQASSTEWLLVSSCDLPLLQLELLDKLQQRLEANPGAAAIAITLEGRLFPFPALYSRRILTSVSARLTEMKLKMVDLLNEIQVDCIPLSVAAVNSTLLWSFLNVNSPEELLLASRLLRGESEQIPPGLLWGMDKVPTTP